MRRTAFLTQNGVQLPYEQQPRIDVLFVSLTYGAQIDVTYSQIGVAYPTPGPYVPVLSGRAGF